MKKSGSGNRDQRYCGGVPFERYLHLQSRLMALSHQASSRLNKPLVVGEQFLTIVPQIANVGIENLWSQVFDSASRAKGTREDNGRLWALVMRNEISIQLVKKRSPLVNFVCTLCLLVVVFSFQNKSFEGVRGNACHSSRVVCGNTHPVCLLFAHRGRGSL